MKTCSEKPELQAGGMYHCPECGMMVLAGLPHPITDGCICLACGADGSRPGMNDPDCEHCSFKGMVIPPGEPAEDDNF
jgi:DNA-directed RNA polymerase subunit RPC12/RpoP